MVVDSLAQQFAGRVKIMKVNVFDNFQLAERFRISVVPQLLVFKGSEEPLERVVGLQSESEITGLLNRVLQS